MSYSGVHTQFIQYAKSSRLVIPAQFQSLRWSAQNTSFDQQNEYRQRRLNSSSISSPISAKQLLNLSSSFTMPSTSLLRIAARGSATFYRANAAARPAMPLMARVSANSFSTSIARRSEHAEETFEQFTAR